MANRENYRLCGGTYFTLILQARKQRMGVRDHYLGKSDGLSDPSVLFGLAKVVATDWQEPLASAEKTVKGNTSRYKACKAAAGTYFPFEDSGAVASFDERIKNNYESCLAAMNLFADTFLEMGMQTKKDEYLAKALVETIAADTTIADDTRFYVCEDGGTLSKSDICLGGRICFQPFLLGVWHYILTHVKDNKVGADTFDAWCPSRNGGERRYTAQLGEKSGLAISLCYSKLITTESDFTSPDDTETVEAEIISPVVEPQGNPGGQTIINHNPVFNTFNIGSVRTFNNQVDHVINNYYGGKKDEQ